MKTITLTQPWATLVAIGAKRIETRSWPTKYRGPLAIHAAAGLGPVGGRAGLHDLAFSDPDGYFYQALKRANVFCIDDLPRGAIVATCVLVDCREIVATQVQVENYWRAFERVSALLPPEEPERAFGDYTPGRFAWLLADVKPLTEPIPARGALGLWEWNEP